MSATLAVGSGGLEPFLRTVGAENLDGARDRLRVDLAKFGSMSFALANREVPAPFEEDGERASAFDDYAAAVVRQALSEGGRALVLAPSFADVDALNRRIEGLVAQPPRRGAGRPPRGARGRPERSARHPVRVGRDGTFRDC